jgi:hypothetical protein
MQYYMLPYYSRIEQRVYFSDSKTQISKRNGDIVEHIVEEMKDSGTHWEMEESRHSRLSNEHFNVQNSRRGTQTSHVVFLQTRLHQESRKTSWVRPSGNFCRR